MASPFFTACRRPHVVRLCCLTASQPRPCEHTGFASWYHTNRKNGDAILHGVPALYGGIPGPTYAFIQRRSGCLPIGAAPFVVAPAGIAMGSVSRKKTAEEPKLRGYALQFRLGCCMIILLRQSRRQNFQTKIEDVSSWTCFPLRSTKCSCSFFSWRWASS